MFEPGKLADLISKPETKVLEEPLRLKGRQTVEHFIAWLETKPADGAYCYWSAGDCLFHHYGLDHGSPKHTAYEDGLDAVNTKIVLAGVAPIKPHTFGAALQRARALRDAL